MDKQNNFSASTIHTSTGGPDEQSKFVDKIASNIKSDLIEITHDKLENILLKHLKNMDVKKSWITPFSIFITVLVTRFTSTFKEFLGLTKEVWDAFFLILTVISFFWLVGRIIQILNCKDKSSIEYLIGLIKSTENK